MQSRGHRGEWATTLTAVTQPPPPPGWYPDPAGGGGSRWWDGQGWSDHVEQAAPRSQPPSSAPVGQAPGSSLYEQPVLVVSQQPRRIERTDEYAVFDGQGNRIGAVLQIGQSVRARGVRLVAELDQVFTMRLEVWDARDPVLVLTRPVMPARLRVLVSRPDGAPIGEIVETTGFGKSRFDLVASGRLVGAVRAVDWARLGLSVTDAAGTEVARITKRWKGPPRTRFTTARKYAVHVHLRPPEPLASMMIASALTVDTALNQHERFD